MARRYYPYHRDTALAGIEDVERRRRLARYTLNKLTCTWKDGRNERTNEYTAHLASDAYINGPSAATTGQLDARVTAAFSAKRHASLSRYRFLMSNRLMAGSNVACWHASVVRSIKLLIANRYFHCASQCTSDRRDYYEFVLYEQHECLRPTFCEFSFIDKSTFKRWLINLLIGNESLQETLIDRRVQNMGLKDICEISRTSFKRT